jgi:uncharacterized protein
LRFEWDERKAASNIKKHEIEFSEAVTVFYDTLAQEFDDETHSRDERREIIIGHSMQHRLLVVAFVERQAGVVRILSARCATRRERKQYEEAHKN